MKTYQLRTCVKGCAFHTTVASTCEICGGPLTAPVAMTREQVLATIRNDSQYQPAKAAVIAWARKQQQAR